ncbi:SHOCT domain-containing protein [Hansschlegelia sp. KR7-227]|jgi:hypothetical protein|uniref:SHOCT domain-containing protein n=1 Tax=Hansschlegelia sp. KR7-227 TaxID=3400914 RepID=UPI003C0E6BE9
MQPLWTEDASRAIGEIARRNGFGEGAGLAMAEALAASAGSMAQFHHSDLGGMGQWSRGGMLMIGDMFNSSLKARVGALADDLADAMARGAIVARRPADGENSSGFGQWWPEELGSPSSTGAQNGRRYAVFPAERRLAVERDGRVVLYDTGDHRIGGASQQQGGHSTLSFSTDRGSIGVEDLREVGVADSAAPEAEPARTQPAPDWATPAPTTETPRDAAPAYPYAPEPREASSPSPASGAEGADPVELIRKLAALKDAGVLTEQEFQAKKTELLARI